MQYLPRSNYKKMPWKNGQGETEEIFLEQDLLRISMAEIKTSGPFSDYKGFSRNITIIEGESVLLKHLQDSAIVHHKLEPLAPYEFCGEWKTSAEIKSPVRDFNVIWKKGHYRCEVELIKLNASESLKVGILSSQLLIFSLSEGLDLEVEGEILHLERFDSAYFKKNITVKPRTSAVAFIKVQFV